MEEPWEGDPNYVDQRVARALQHPMRVQILGELNKRVMSPSEFAEQFEEPLSNVSYHFRTLKKLDCIEEVEIRHVRGAVEHFYKATKRALFDGKTWDGLPEPLKSGMSGQTIEDLLAAITLAMSAETFDAHNDRVLVWLQRRLDKKGWREAVEAHRDLIRKMMQIYKDADLRLHEAGEPKGGILGSYAVFLFESPPPEPDGPEED